MGDTGKIEMLAKYSIKSRVSAIKAQKESFSRILRNEKYAAILTRHAQEFMDFFSAFDELITMNEELMQVIGGSAVLIQSEEMETVGQQQ